jgi:hypothetical protein
MKGDEEVRRLTSRTGLHPRLYHCSGLTGGQAKSNYPTYPLRPEFRTNPKQAIESLFLASDEDVGG